MYLVFYINSYNKYQSKCLKEAPKWEGYVLSPLYQTQRKKDKSSEIKLELENFNED
jgi:hypothetical protein